MSDKLLSLFPNHGPWTQRTIYAPIEGRRVVAYVSGGTTVIGKFYPDDEGQTAFDILQKLSHVAFSVLRIPEAYAYDPGQRLLLMAPAEGSACKGIDLETHADTLRRIGRALRELHEIPWPGPAKTMHDHIAELVRPHPSALAEALPAFRRVIDDALADLAAATTDTPVACLHRDFHLRQLFDDGVRIDVIDWDLCAAGDPAFDVAYFTAYLKNHYPASTAEAGVRSFLEGYDPSDGVAARIPVYERFNYLRRACRRFRLKDEGWEEAMGEMLGRLG